MDGEKLGKYESRYLSVDMGLCRMPRVDKASHNEQRVSVVGGDHIDIIRKVYEKRVCELFT